MRTKEIYTVSRLAFEARGAIEKRFALIWIEGEISNLSRPASGHLYFTLKDQQSQVRCALFRNRRRQLGTEPENGKQVLIRARVTLYEGRSEFQIMVEQVEPIGEGALLQQLEALKTTLQAEGLFAETHKKKLPAYPRTIALITSPVGAAIRDLLITFERRYPAARIILLPSEVQGKDAASRLCDRIAQAEQIEGVDLIILSRGGGSIEDLHAFNDEQLVRTIFACNIPVIAGIGHESDWTLADLVADLRAATPTAAAELATPDQRQLQEWVNQLQTRLTDVLERRLRDHQQHLDGERRRLIHPGQKLHQFSERLTHNWHLLTQLQRSFNTHHLARLKQVETRLLHYSPLQPIYQHHQRINQLYNGLNQHINTQLSARKQQTGEAAAALTVLNPLATLARGYAVVRNPQNNQIISGAGQINPSDPVQIQLSDANLNCIVETIEIIEPLESQ
ncbi:MAG: exodeoxyribonuclease VII large subunit [Gammaproteobacteria bacterium]|nr:MAG: exodeoxyribonuclease VII large subunit [Gammaproteobacteria bacterium]